MSTLSTARMVVEANRLDETKQLGRKLFTEKYDHVPNPFGDGPIGSTSSGKLVHGHDHECYGGKDHGHPHFKDWSKDDHNDAAAKHDQYKSMADEHHEIFSGIEHDPSDPDMGSAEDFNKQKSDMLGKLKEMSAAHGRLAHGHRKAGKG